jgi:hypothetical protein
MFQIIFIVQLAIPEESSTLNFSFLILQISITEYCNSCFNLCFMISELQFFPHVDLLVSFLLVQAIVEQAIQWLRVCLQELEFGDLILAVLLLTVFEK